MIHFVPDAAPSGSPAPYAEAVARLASLTNALRLVDPASAVELGEDDAQIASSWSESTEAVRQCFTARSERTIGAAAAGLEALFAERSAGREPNPRSIERLADEIRTGLEDLQRLLNR